VDEFEEEMDINEAERIVVIVLMLLVQIKQQI